MKTTAQKNVEKPCLNPLEKQKMFYFCKTFSPGGGIGRRAWLRAMFRLRSASSILVLGTVF